MEGRVVKMAQQFRTAVAFELNTYGVKEMREMLENRLS